MIRTPKKSSIVLWVLAPLLLGLSVVRPPNPRNDRASRVPERMGDFELAEKMTITPSMERLLGTRDVAWLVFRDAAENQVFLTAVFHDSNWKSLHPPHICIRGSNFNINEDTSVDMKLDDGRELTVGRLQATKQNDPTQEYVSLYAFVGRDFVTSSYLGFYLEHAPRALVRKTTSGFLLRVEAFVGKDGPKATLDRCWNLFQAFLPVGEDLIRPR